VGWFKCDPAPASSLSPSFIDSFEGLLVSSSDVKINKELEMALG
jgi:hypothetical protein